MPDIIPQDDQLTSTFQTKHHSKPRYLMMFGLASLLVLGGLIIAIASFQSSQDNRQRAATGEPVLKFDQPAKTVAPDDNFTLKAVLDSGSKQLTAVALKISYDPSILAVDDVSNANGFPVELTAPSFNQATGIITYTLGVPATGFIFTGVNPVANINFKALKAGATTVSYDQTFSAATELNNPSPNVVLGYISSVITVQDATVPPVSDPPVSDPPVVDPPPVADPVSCGWCGATCVDDPDPEQCSTDAPPVGSFCQAIDNKCELLIPKDTTPPSLSTSFMLQGLAKPNIEVPMQLTTTYVVSGEEKSDVYEVIGTSSSENQVKVVNVSLSKLPTGFIGEVKILVKPTVALRKNIGSIQIVSGTPTYNLVATDKTVLVGDYVRGVDANGRDQTNILGVIDLTRVINVFRAANDIIVPVTDQTREMDVDYNGRITIMDLLFAKNNLDDVYLLGE